MKSSLITVVTFASVMVFSGTAFAGGENCSSKRGAHKDMSAAVTKDGTDHHGWVASQDTVKVEPSEIPSAEVKQEVPLQPLQGTLKI